MAEAIGSRTAARSSILPFRVSELAAIELLFFSAPCFRSIMKWTRMNPTPSCLRPADGGGWGCRGRRRGADFELVFERDDDAGAARAESVRRLLRARGAIFELAL